MYFNNIRNRNVLINQPAGIGDIIFTIKIANNFIENGNKITWPIGYNYKNIEKNFPNIGFINTKDFHNFLFYEGKQVFFEDEEYLCLPLQHAHRVMNAGCMEAKYKMMNVDFRTWKDIEVTRDHKKENELFNVLGLKENDKYTLVNHNWDSRVLRRDFKLLEEDNNRKIEMHIINGFNLFDWTKVLQFADRIHTVSTSLIYLLELFDLKASKIFLYERVDGNGLSDIDFFLTKKYIYHV